MCGAGRGVGEAWVAHLLVMPQVKQWVDDELPGPVVRHLRVGGGEGGGGEGGGACRLGGWEPHALGWGKATLRLRMLGRAVPSAKP